MKKLSFLFFLPALAAAATQEFSPSVNDLQDPPKALAKSAFPVSMAGFLLEAGEGSSVSAFTAGLSDKQSDLANKLRSQAAFYGGDVPGALQALELVEKTDAWTTAQKKHLQDLMALTAEDMETRSDHFTLLLPKKDAFLAQYTLPALERAYEKTVDFYDVSFSTPLRVELYVDAAAFAQAAYVPPDSLEKTGVLTAAKFGRIYLLSPQAVPAGYRWLDAAAAALHRCAVNRLSGGMAPVWVKEGLARRGEDEWRREGIYLPSPADANRLAEAALVNPSTGTLLIPFARMEPNLRVFRRQEDVLLAQVQSADAAEFILKEHGREKIQALLAAFRRLPREEAFTQTLGMKESDVEAAWTKSLEGSTWTLAKGALDRRISFQNAELPAGPEVLPFLHAGDALRDKRQWQPALVQYRKGLALEPENGILLARAARAALSLEDAPSAEAFLRRAVEKNPFYLPPFASLGQLLYDDGRYDEAQRVLQEGLEIQPFNPRLHETLGYISMDVGDIAAARSSFQISLEFDPNNPNLRDTLGNMPKGPK